MKLELTQPAFARRIRLSTFGITAAVTLTCLALLAIGVAVGPGDGETGSSVSFEAPEASQGAASIAPSIFSTGGLQPVSDSVAGSLAGSVAGSVSTDVVGN